jgi:imidazolonepropionase-like amidohydrolase
VDGDPLANVTVLQHVKLVMKGGVIARNDDDTRIVPR